VLLATDAASEGLNLHQHCRIVVHYELPWHPMRLEQRAGRVDRIGQAKRVHEIAFVASTTAERLVVAPLTIRASRPGMPGVSPVSAAGLTESRVAEAVMGGLTPIIGGKHTTKNSPGEGRTVDLNANALAEAARIELHRTLVARSDSSRGRLRADSAFATLIVRTRRTRRERPNNQVALVYSFDFEDLDGRRVHSDVVTLRFTTANDTWRGRSLDRLTEIASAFNDPVMQAELPSLQQAIRHAIERLEPVLLTARAQLRQRRHFIITGRWSTAQTLVQPRLFTRRTRSTSVGRLEPDLPVPDAALVPRIWLVAVVATLER
jgi:hypothetical protein